MSPTSIRNLLFIGVLLIIGVATYKACSLKSEADSFNKLEDSLSDEPSGTDVLNSDTATTNVPPSRIEDEEDQEVPVAPAPKSNSVPVATNPAPVETPSSTKEGYFVVAGTFSVAANAETLVSKLQKAGFSDAELVKFKGEKSSSVITGRYKTEADAIAARNTVNSNGVMGKDKAYTVKRTE
jgi:cell division protein FtsN